MEESYDSAKECFEDRRNHRELWYKLICEYNKDDLTRLAKDVCAGGYGYTGLRDIKEVEACIKEGVFTHVIWISNPRLRENDKTMTFGLGHLHQMQKDHNFKVLSIANAGSIGALGVKVKNIVGKFLAS